MARRARPVRRAVRRLGSPQPRLEPALRGHDFRDAEQWLAQQGSHAESATDAQVGFILTSRRAAARRRQALFGAVLLALAVSSVLAIIAVLQRNDARQAARTAAARSFAFGAMQNLDDDADIALLLGLEAYRLRPDYEARNAMISARQKVAGTPLSAIVRAPVSLTSVAFSPNGRLLASGGSDGAVRLWDIAARKPLDGPLRGHQGAVQEVAFSHDGELVASVGRDGTIRIWHVHAHPSSERPLARGVSGAKAVAFGSGRRLVVVAADGTIRTWDVATRKPTGVSRFDPDGGLNAAALDPNATTVGGVSDKSATVLKLAGGKAQQLPSLPDPSPYHDQYTAAALSPNGLYATADIVGAIKLWDLRRRPKQIAVLVNPGGGIFGLAFDSAGRFLATTDDLGRVSLWDVLGRRRLPRLVGQHARALSVRFSTDGRWLASVSGDGRIRLWDLRLRPQPPRLGRANLRGIDFIPNLVGIAFSQDGRRLVTLSERGDVRTWDVRRRQPIGPVFRIRGVITFAFDRSARMLAVGTEQGAVSLWDVTTAEQLRPLAHRPGSRYGARSLAFSPDGRFLATTRENEASLWDVRDRRPVGKLPRGAGSYAVPPPLVRTAASWRFGARTDRSRSGTSVAGASFRHRWRSRRMNRTARSAVRQPTLR